MAGSEALKPQKEQWLEESWKLRGTLIKRAGGDYEELLRMYEEAYVGMVVAAEGESQEASSLLGLPLESWREWWIKNTIVYVQWIVQLP